MRNRIGFLLTAVICLIFGSLFAQPYQQEVPDDYDYIVRPGQEVPDFDLLLLDGSKLNIKDLRGKVVMLQFTASWCSVCRREMPHIEEDIWLEYRDNPGFALYGIDLDEPAERVREFQKEIGVTYPLTLDPDGSIFYRFAAAGAGVTRNVIIDREGKIAFMTRLYKEDEFSEMIEVIDSLVSGKK